MSNVITAVNTVAPPSATRTRKSRTWRKNDRRIIKNLLRQCKNMQNRDFRELVKSVARGVDARLFIGSQGSGIDNALRALIRACNEALADRG